MKKMFLLVTIILHCTSIVIAQTYTEILEGGWGQGMNNSKAFFLDLDNDGLLDLILGGYEGYLAHYEQSTTNANDFTLISRRFNRIDVGTFSAPTFIDLENDGLLDLIIGESNGNLNHYKQFSVASDSFALVTAEFNGIDVGYKSIPNFIDLDNDGLLDLIISSQDGTIYHYEQDPSDSMVFILISNNFSNISSAARVCFTDLDNDNLFDMITGGTSGDFKHYEQDSFGSLNFSLISEKFSDINLSMDPSATFTDIDNDGLLDLITGEYLGHIKHYEQDVTGSTTFNLITEKLLDIIDVGRISSPIFTDLDDDGFLDMIIGADDSLFHYKQNDIDSNNFTLISSNFIGINIGDALTPVITDLDSDGLMDLVIGEYDGNLNHYEQTSVGSTTFVLVSEYFNGIDLGENSSPSFTDLDNDGLLDMIVGEGEGDLHLYEQDGIGSTTFTLISDSLNGIDVGYDSHPVFTDLDNDGLLDLIVGNYDGNLNHYEQNASGSLNFMLISENFLGIKVNGFSKPVFIDINGDGMEDLLVGERSGGIHHFQRNLETAVEENTSFDSKPLTFKIYQNYPNPFNPGTTIQYDLHKSVKVNISIYNSLGQKVIVLVNKIQPAGSYTVQWDGKDEQKNIFASGTYICTIQADEFSQSVKLLLIR